MSKVRVPLHQQPNKFAVLDTAATVGATVGVNLFLPDGTVIRAEDILNSSAPSAPALGGGTIPNNVPLLWTSLVGKPQNVVEVEALSGDGVLTRKSGEGIKTKSLINGTMMSITESPAGYTFNVNLSDSVLAGAAGATFDGGTTVLSPGIACDVRVPYRAQVVRATILSDVSTTSEVDVRKTTFALYPADPADSICGSSKPSLVSAVAAENSSLSGWATTIEAGEILRFVLEANTAARRLTVVLELRRI